MVYMLDYEQSERPQENVELKTTYRTNTVCTKDFPALFIKTSSYNPAATPFPNAIFFTSFTDETVISEL